MPTIDRPKLVAAAVAITLPALAGFEGVRQWAYRDPVGVPTYCMGETENVQWGRKYSLAECNALARSRVQQFANGVLACTRVELTPEQLAALTSFAYNVGTQAYCGSTLAKRVNRGELPGACAELERWVYAKGIKLPGLVNRRAAERAMCEGRA